jgi:hypothetical protein
MTVASFFRKYNVGCILNYVRLIITREISCIYIQLLLQLCTEVSRVTTQRRYNENLKLTSDAQLIVFARSAKKLDSLDFSLPCRAANDFR